MKRLPWIVSLGLAFAAGWWLGGQQAVRQVATSTAELVVQPAGSTLAREPAVAPVGSAGARDLITGEDWPALLDLLDALARQGRKAEAAELRLSLLDRVRSWSASGRQQQAEQSLRAYIDRNPHDPEARLALSEVLQMQGRLAAAMTPLLEALQVADEPDMIARLRAAMALLVSVHESRLAAEQNMPALIRFFEGLTLADPGFDGHRLKLARWLLLAGRYEQAETVVAQMGLVGVTPEARGDLEAEIRLARSGLPVRWSDRALHVQVSAAGRQVRMLVDTGASTTAVSRAAAATLGTEATGRTVEVRTAGGTILADVHRIRDFRVGELRLPILEVLVMERAPPGAEGLLGMDVLARFPGLSGASGLLGRPASSG